ncbi:MULTISPECIES: GNAT family N-acetyltransferase [Streptomyces]|uniref:GNAT family N-acetyltransferase n=1 Tax=Streptomyces lycii TaxID=2654337 RepID=A0ABQ7FBL1_9ACTN|nr:MULTISPECIES: GNAT family N-acetyltransferase [Streptomyces]KAF4406000.1 GNAT family N-acetyltransferase [Streptomyces lycii]PGH50366.1 GNAT family N-acetyltransferase [Streptomyces sp. Ru87]
MTTELRVLRQTEWDAWYGQLELAFGGIPEAPEERSLWNDLTETERSLGVWDDGACVGTAGAFSFRLAVPGGSVVPAAGVTMVSVASTHRRRGILTSMMRRQLSDVRSGGEPLAVLTASEPAIYGRFGYGIGTQQMSLDIDTARVRLTVPEGTDGVRLRISDPVAAVERCEAVYARRVPVRPGMLARRPGWARLPVLDPESERAGASPLQCVLAERDGETVGYARYAVKPDWDAEGPKGIVQLRDLEALDPAAYAALWRHLFDLDLTSRLTTRNRPVDDPVLHLVSDVRRCSVRVRDGLHVRPVELGAALETRTYARPVDVVLDVSDPFCPWNEGRWRISGDAKGASCERTGDPAELALSVRELGAAFLGGVSLGALAGAGRVRELRQGALAEASGAFLGDVAPWLPHGF